MFVKIPFESTIDFKTHIDEITKMSLEHDFNVNDGRVLGNFYISGEYKAYEVSVNTESFKYTLPFTIEVREDIKKDSLEFNIEDFSYEIEGDTLLKVYIEYSLSGEKEEKEESEDNTENERELEVEFEKIEDQEIDAELKQIDEVLQKEEKKEEAKENSHEERLTSEEEKTIMETIKNEDDTFVTYHVHIVKESETIEEISTIYNVPSSLIKEYNDVDNVSIGDKIIIPKCDE